MKTNEGLNIQIDDELKDFAQTREVEEVNTSSGEILNPKTIVNDAAKAAVDNNDIDKKTKESKDDVGLKIIKDEEEEEEEEEEDDDDDDAGSGDDGKTIEDDADDNDGVFKTIGKHFSDEGLLHGFDESMENTPEAFKEMIEKTIQKGIEDYKSKFSDPTAKQFLEYMENGGDPNRFIEMVSAPDYSRITEEYVEGNVEIQKQLLRNQLSLQGEEAEDIEDAIQAFEDSGHLEKRSLAALKKLQKAQENEQKELIESQKQAALKRREENEKILTNLKETIDSSDEIGGFKLTPKTKNQFFDYITKVNPKTGKTGLIEDSSDPKKQLLMSFLYFNKFDFTKLEKQVGTTEAKKLEEKLARFTDGSKKQQSRHRTKVDKVEPGKLNLGPMKKLFG